MVNELGNFIGMFFDYDFVVLFGVNNVIDGIVVV